MSAAQSLMTYSDNALRLAHAFLRTYKPEYREKGWVKTRKAELEAEITRRQKEETEAAR